MQIGFKVPQANITWDALKDLWLEAESLGVFDSGWLFDHFVATDNKPGGAFEALSVAAALAAMTSRLRMGHLVLSNTYRHPVMVAKAALTLDHISRGRFVVGLGAGWHPLDHGMLGIPLPPLRERLGMLDEATRIMKGIWRAPRFPISFSGTYYSALNVIAEPEPFSTGGPKLWLGTQGLKLGLPLAAQIADGWNATGSFEDFLVKRAALYASCRRAGRSESSIEVSSQVFDRGVHADLLNEARRYSRAGVDHLIFVLAPDTTPADLRRLAGQVVEPLIVETN